MPSNHAKIWTHEIRKYSLSIKITTKYLSLQRLGKIVLFMVPVASSFTLMVWTGGNLCHTEDVFMVAARALERNVGWIRNLLLKCYACKEGAIQSPFVLFCLCTKTERAKSVLLKCKHRFSQKQWKLTQSLSKVIITKTEVCENAKKVNNELHKLGVKWTRKTEFSDSAFVQKWCNLDK